MVVVAFALGLLLAHHKPQPAIPPFAFSQEGVEVQMRLVVDRRYVTLAEWDTTVMTCKTLATKFDDIPATNTAVAVTLYCET